MVGSKRLSNSKNLTKALFDHRKVVFLADVAVIPRSNPQLQDLLQMVEDSAEEIAELNENLEL